MLDKCNEEICKFLSLFMHIELMNKHETLLDTECHFLIAVFRLKRFPVNSKKPNRNYDM